MANLTRSTQDREEIRRWAEERGGRPAHVRQTGSGEDVGILRIDFPGYTGEESLEQIDWDTWLDKFEDRNLALIYQEETAGGARSNFNKIVSAATTRQTGKKKSGTATKKKAAKAAAKSRGKAAAKKSSSRASKKAVRKSASKRGGKGTAKKAGPKKSASKKKVARKRR